MNPAWMSYAARPESAWITRDLEQKALAHAIADVVPEHLKEVRDRRIDMDRKDPRRGQGPAHQGDQLLGPSCRGAEASGAGRQD